MQGVRTVNFPAVLCSAANIKMILRRNIYEKMVAERTVVC